MLPIYWVAAECGQRVAQRPDAVAPLRTLWPHSGPRCQSLQLSALDSLAHLTRIGLREQSRAEQSAPLNRRPLLRAGISFIPGGSGGGGEASPPSFSLALGTGTGLYCTTSHNCCTPAKGGSSKKKKKSELLLLLGATQTQTGLSELDGGREKEGRRGKERDLPDSGWIRSRRVVVGNTLKVAKWEKALSKG